MFSRMDTDKIKAQSEEELLAEAVQRLVAALDPEQIYLFGSRARGDYRQGSDYDLMVIVSDSASSNPHPFVAGNQAIAGLPFHKDLKVYHHTKFYKQTHLKASMPSAVLRDGKLLYRRVDDAGYSGTGPSAAPVVCEASPPSFDPVLLENTREWIQRANADLLGAEELVNGPPYMLELVLFHCQQSVEKSIKAFLTWHDCRFDRTHNLSELAQPCLQCDPTLSDSLERTVWLSEWSVRGRYPMGLPLPGRDEAEAGLRNARDFMQEIIQRLPESTRP